jgi:tellurite resistance protein
MELMKGSLMAKKITTQEALIYVMVMVSASDRSMTDAELARIGLMTRYLPVFEGFDDETLIDVSRDCATFLQGPEGLDIVLEIIRDTLPSKLYDTAYSIGVEIASADLAVNSEEIRMLQMLRDRLGLDKLTCAAIERSAIARFRKA